MNQVRKWNIIGGRVIKQELRFSYSSSLRIFQYTNYFAVITAIVTIEPTATDSIKRTSSFPASTIGSAYAMTFTFFLGHQALLMR